MRSEVRTGETPVLQVALVIALALGCMAQTSNVPTPIRNGKLVTPLDVNHQTFVNAENAVTSGTGASNIVQTVGDANATIASNTDVVVLTTVLSAPRVLTLPAAVANKRVRILDSASSSTVTNTLSVGRAGSNTINGSTANVVVSPPLGGTVYAELVASASNWTTTSASTAANAIQSGSVNLIDSGSSPSATGDIVGFNSVTGHWEIQTQNVNIPVAGTPNNGDSIVASDASHAAWQAASGGTAGSQAFQNITPSGTTFTIPVSSSVVKQNSILTLTTNSTLAFTGLFDGAFGEIRVFQPSSAATLALPAGSTTANGGGGSVTLSSGSSKQDMLEWSCRFAAGNPIIAFKPPILNLTTSPPGVPTGLIATAGNTQITLSWNAVAGATSYSAYRGTSAGAESGTAIATGIATTVYTNTGLTNGTAYFYKVTAINSNGESAQSSEATNTPSGSSGPNIYYNTTDTSPNAVVNISSGFIDSETVVIAQSGTVTKLGMFVGTIPASRDFKIALYDSSGALVASTTGIISIGTANSNSWVDLTGLSVAVSSGTYKIAISGDPAGTGIQTLKSLSAQTGHGHYSSGANYSTFPPSVLPSDTGTTGSIFLFRVFVQ